jgi:hypothetical protein
MVVKMSLLIAALGVCMSLTGDNAAAETKRLRPPAVPLVTHDPYFSTWSMADRLTDDWPKHWTGGVTAMCGMARIDGRPYRFMGTAPTEVPVMEQTGLEVTPTRTIYRFEAGGIGMTLTFMSPLLPKDLEVFARPVTYLTWDVKSLDGKPHSVALYLDASGEWAAFSGDQQVTCSRFKCSGMNVLRIGTEDQPVLKRAGDGVKIDWGYMYLAVPGASDDAMTSDQAVRNAFASTGKLPDSDDTRMPRAVNDNWPVLACTYDLGEVGEKTVSRHVMLAYDEIYAIEYLQRKLRPYWRRNGMDIGGLLSAAEKDYPSLVKKCAEFDKQLMGDLAKVGGALAYRQCVAGCGFAADFDGELMVFTKENSSNGCIATVDVIYPGAPFFLLFSPEMMKANLTPVMEYARSARWKWPFAPHDLGQYPLANGQVYGGGERTEENQMPVEESGNMILMIAGIAKIEGTADYAEKYWPVLTKWAEYLRDKGLDPENQLCTDDFTGHLAHNANLSVKAILALDAYGMLADMTGRKDIGATYHKLAREMAAKWIQMADDGDHTRLAFDKPGTWSQKYNLVWDRLLGLNVFPAEVARKEIAFYKTKLTKLGLPLDSRSTLTKTDWSLWTATMADSKGDFEVFVNPMYDYFNETSKRIVMTDLYMTDNLDSGWLNARPVIGGVFIRMLADPAVWRKWGH